MKLEDTWKDIATGNASIDHNEVLESIRNRKGDVLHKLQQKLMVKIVFTIAFSVLYTVLLFFVTDLIVQLLFTAILLAHLVAIVYFSREYKDMKKLIPMDGNIRDTLVQYRQRVLRVIRNEEKVGLFLYPLAVSAGFFFSLMQDKTWDEVMNERLIWIIWISVTVLFTPLGHYVAKRLNRIAFGKQLSKLEKMIEEIERTE
jgi:hypothetical protein